MTYATPIQDMVFSLYRAAGFGEVQKQSMFQDVTDDLVNAILVEAGKFNESIIAPLNRIGDQHPAAYHCNTVTTPPGFKEAYSAYVEAGWNSLAFPTQVGGQGLPHTLAVILIDALNAGCMAFAIGPTLTIGAAKAIAAAGTDEQKHHCLEKLVTGEWTGAMNLTEPQAGSDLSSIRTRARRVGDGKYLLQGQKIYITYGEHDLSENIIHLVLARIEGAPEGTAGISMFLVPKYHINQDGSLGERNDVQCIGLEHKLGMHGSPTATMAFGETGECIGTLLGEENKGLRNMFVMMNSARLDVGMQAIGVSERAYQHARAFAEERRQGRSLTAPSEPQSPIINHPDVRRMLMTMKSLIEAGRAICYATAIAHDLSRSCDDGRVREKHSMREALLTPIAKAWCSDRANEITSIGLQVHGGMGFVEETGAAQLMRDVRIATIYEGTNGIQAIDLLLRKILKDAGRAAFALLEEIAHHSRELCETDDPSLCHVGETLSVATKNLRLSTEWMLDTERKEEDALSAATPYLKQFGNVVGCYFLARGVAPSTTLDTQPEIPNLYRSERIALAKFFADNFLNEANGLGETVRTQTATELSMV